MRASDDYEEWRRRHWWSWETAAKLFFAQDSWDYSYRYNWDFVRNWRDEPALVWC